MRAASYFLLLGLASCAWSDGLGSSSGLDLSADAASGNNAVAATNDFLSLFFYLPSYNLRDTHPFDGVWAMPDDYWEYAQAFDAVLDAVERSKGTEFETHAQQLFKGWHDWPGQWKRTWFDDENWIALALLHADRVVKEPNGDYLGLATSTYDDIWARGATHDSAGHFSGIYESIAAGPAYLTKAAVSNFGPAITAARLRDMTEAEDIYAWAREHLSDPSTGEVYDHVDPNGQAVAWQYTYNYGVAIGAALELYQITNAANYRDDAY
jgi:predicted alpha-1,6-mannanase (GH76 family)